MNKPAVAMLVGRTLAEVENLYRYGVIGDTAWRQYMFFWSWTAPRFSGAIGRRHDRAYERLGREGYQRRIERVRALAAKAGLTNH